MINHTHVAAIVLSKKVVIGEAVMLGVVAIATPLIVDPMVFAAASVLIISAIAAAAVTIINALSAMKRDLLTKQAEILSQGAVIKGHVDGMTTAGEAKRTAMEDEIMSLHAQIARLQSTADLLAQARVTVDTATAVPATSIKTT